MAKFLQRLFSGGSSSSKRSSLRASHTSVHESSQRPGASANMRAATSLESLASYNINPRELEKNKLHKASWEGDIHKVERLARPGLVDQQDQQSRTPLHMAVARGHLSIVQRLVHEGARLNLVDNDQRTPLVKAVLSGNHNQPLYYQICIALLQGGADAFINAVDNSGKNALHYSIEYGNEDLVDLFLSFQNCDANFRDRDQMTPLHLAVKRNSPNIVDILLSDRHTHQADPNLTNRNGQTPLHMAASLGYADIIQVILQSNLSEPCDPTILDTRQLSAYQLAQENHHDECAKLIDDYQHGWTKLSPRRNTLESINEHEINPVIRNPAGRFRDDDEDDNYSESTTSEDTNQFSKSSSRRIQQQQQQPSNQWLNRSTPVINQNKQETYSLADLIKKNPLQPDSSKTYETKPNNQTLSNLVNSMPLKPDESRTHVSKPNNQTLSNLMHNIPLQPDEKSTNKSMITPQKQPPSIFGIGPTILQREDSDNISTSMSIERPSINKNLIGGPTLSSKKNVTISSLIQSLPQPESNDSNSWTYDKSSVHKQEPITKPATRIETSDDTSLSHSDDDDNNVGNIYRTKTASTNFPKPPTLNHTSGFTTTRSNEQLNNTDSDEDSIEAAVRQINTQKSSFGIQNLVNQQIGNNFKTSQQIPISNVQAPITEDYLYTTSSIGSNNEPTTKGISNLVQHQPLLSKKTSESTWDDSRPLSADLERNSIKSKTHTAFSSSDSDTDQDQKSATIVKSPVKNGAIANFIQTSMRPTEFNEKKPTGVENLIKIIDDIKHSPPTKQNQSIPHKPIGTLITSSMLHRNDSLSSDASSIVADSVRTLAMAIPTIPTSKPQLYHDEVDKLHWPSMTNDRHDFKHITDKYSNEIIPSSQRQSSRTLAHHEFNSLRGSMSSSTSSIQNNMERLSELKEDIKQIERKQEDSLELKRQLKDMEIKKNNFEALYKKNDQLLRETETKLEKEINEKQRLEWATKNLNMELKSVKQKLQSLEEEKDILNQRCVKLKDERDNYDEKLRIHQVNSLQSVTAAGVLREEDIEKIKLRHREEMKLLSAENDDLHQRTKQLQSDLQLHKESLDVTIRYKIDLEKALEEKTFLQHELDRLKHERDLIEQEKIDFKTKYDNLQEEIRLMLLDRSKLEQKLTNELQEQMKQRQRSTDDIKKYKAQIEQLNIKLGDAEARLLVLQTQNEALLASKDRDIKNEFDTLTQRLNTIESEKLNAEQRFRNEQKDITNKQQQHILHEPLVLLTSTPLNNALQQQHHQHSSSSPCIKCDTLQRSYEHEREQRIQTEKDNERLRDVVSRQKQHNDLNKSLQQHQEYEHNISENSKQIRSETGRVKHELDRLRHDFDKLVSNYDSPNNLQQQTQLHSQIDTLRQFYEQEFRQQLLLSKLTNEMKPSPPPPTTIHHYHRTSSPIKHDEHEHSLNGNSNCLACSSSRLLKERLENAIDTSLADQRIQTIKQMPILPRLTSPLLPTNNNTTSSLEILRKFYHV
ncbi:unnamed protein product [Rotaria sordida]|uniref:Uncharacterized protein n=1 Tax=Rotaria sordida TaxID=392033 RepID=A0A813ZTE5_9BILA|nr:unnamed protein product [Rotaria sordida]CAF1296443.1 unnamed protein product [Rotaria sordida]